MKTSKLLPLALLFALFATMLHAQMSPFHMPKYKEVLACKDRQLIVVVNPPDAKMVAKLAKRGTQDAMNLYQNVIGNYNTDMKNAVTKFWTFNSQPVLYKTRDEIKEMYKDKTQRDKYVIIYCYSLGMGPTFDFDWNVNKDGTKIEGTRLIFSIGTSLNEDPFYQIASQLQEFVPSAVQLFFYVSQTNAMLNYLIAQQKDCKMQDMIAANAHLLSQKTLLLNKDDINKDFINDIKTAYPCNFKVLPTPDEEIKAVSTGNPNDAYVIITGEGNLYMNWVVSCADGTILAYTTFNNHAAFTKVHNGFDKDFFTDIAKFCEGTEKK